VRAESAIVAKVIDVQVKQDWREGTGGIEYAWSGVEEGKNMAKPITT